MDTQGCSKSSDLPAKYEITESKNIAKRFSDANDDFILKQIKKLKPSIPVDMGEVVEHFSEQEPLVGELASRYRDLLKVHTKLLADHKELQGKYDEVVDELQTLKTDLELSQLDSSLLDVTTSAKE